MRKLRLDRGLTQAQLAALAKVTPAYLARVETDRQTRASQAVIERLAKALHVSAAALMLAGGYLPPEIVRACNETPEEMLWFARLTAGERRQYASEGEIDQRVEDERRLRRLARRLRDA